MSTQTTVRVAALVALLVHTPLSAQPFSIWSLERGDRIRLTEKGLVAGSRGTSTIGQFDALAGDTIRLMLEGGGSSTFALNDVARIDLSRGRQRATKYGIGVGVAVGMVIGLASGNSNRGTCDPNVDPRCGLQIGPVTVSREAANATIAGLAIGGIVGSFIKYEVWNDVTFGLSPQGFALTLTMESSAGKRVRKNALPSRSMRR
jgi:hypothetical protein